MFLPTLAPVQPGAPYNMPAIKLQPPPGSVSMGAFPHDVILRGLIPCKTA